MPMRKSKGRVKEAAKRKADSKARIVLFPDFAGLPVVVERVNDDEIRVRKEKVRPGRIPLGELLAGITPESLHGEIQTGRVVGNEVW